MTRLPCRCSRQEHGVDFLDLEACRLRYAEEDEDGGRGDEPGPHKGDFCADRSLDNGRDEGNHYVHPL